MRKPRDPALSDGPEMAAPEIHAASTPPEETRAPEAPPAESGGDYAGEARNGDEAAVTRALAEGATYVRARKAVIDFLYTRHAHVEPRAA